MSRQPKSTITILSQGPIDTEESDFLPDPSGTPLTPAFGDIPEGEPEPPPKRSRRPKDLPTEIDRHIAMIHEAHQAVQRCKRLHEKTGVRLANATRDYAASQKELDAAQAELNRLMGITTPPETTENPNPETPT